MRFVLFRHTHHDLALPRAPLPVWLATLLLNVLGLAMPLAILQIFSRVIPSNATETLIFMTLGLAVVMVLEFILREARSRLLSLQSASVAHKLGQRLTDAQLFADPLVQNRVSRRRRLTQMQAAALVGDGLAGTGRLHVIELPFVALALGGIALLAGPLVFVPLAGLGVLALAALGLRQRQTFILQDREEADQARYDFWSDVLNHISGVKAAQMEPGLRAKYQDLQFGSSAASMASIRSAALFDSFSTVAGYSFASATVLVGAFLVTGGAIGPAELAACTMLSTRAVQPMLQLIKHWGSGASAKAPLNAARAGLATPMIARDTPQDAPARLQGEIRFENVTMRPTQSGRATLRGQSFEVPAQSFAKLDSTARGGPESVVGLLLGELVPNEGRVTLDGKDPRALMHRRGAGGLVYVNHEPVILNATIIENIAGVIDAGNIKRAYEAADRVGITEFVNTLPYGFDTHMRETGMHESSKGFLQLINVARALAQDPAVLLLTDCCSHLDESMQARLVDTLKDLAGDVTILAYDQGGIFDRAVQHTIELGAPRSVRARDRGARMAPPHGSAPVTDASETTTVKNVAA